MLLISDANIFIDLDKIDLLDTCNQLSYKIITTDFVYNELYSQQKETLDKLNIEQLTFEAEEMIDFYTKYSQLGNVGISPEDYSLIYKAKKENCSILTGDRALRNYIIKEHIQVFGIFFILDSILEQNLISEEEWKIKLKTLQTINQRLPKKKKKKRLH